MIDYREHPAPGLLDRYAECVWSIDMREEQLHPVAPDGCVDVVYSESFGFRVVGAMTRRRDARMQAGSWTVGVRFRPGMAATFFGVSAAEFTDGLVEVRDLWPRRWREVEERLGHARSTAELRRILGAQMGRPAKPLSGIHLALAEIARSGGRAELLSVARQANLSERQFRRRCLEESGLAPKQLCRILRFRHLRELACSTERPAWAQVAVEAGYFDQAHMIRDYREFMGETPMTVSSNTAAAELP